MSKNNFDKAVLLGETLEDLSETYDLYIVFIDLCGSTEIKQFCLDYDIPDFTWITRQNIFLSRSAKIIQQYSGNVVKTIGDEIMATFPVRTNASDIIKCIAEIFNTFDNLKSYKKGNFKIFSKAAIDFGTCYNGQLLNIDLVDPIGSCVDRCARLEGLASKNEILFSTDFYELLVGCNFKFDNYQQSQHKEKMKGLGETEYYKITL